jgi:hypothetical protein
MNTPKDVVIFILGGLVAHRIFSTRTRSNPRGCNPATQDSQLNRANKEEAVEIADYGPDPFGKGFGLAKKVDDVYIRKVDGVLPLLVSSGHSAYWQAKAQRTETSTQDAREHICGNCKAFDVSEQQVECGGAGGKLVAVICAVSGHPRPSRTYGFCQAYKFGCSAFRTCDSWVGGGPRGL